MIWDSQASPALCPTSALSFLLFLNKSRRLHYSFHCMWLCHHTKIMVLSAVNGPWEHLGGMIEAASSPFTPTWRDSESSALVSGVLRWYFVQMYLRWGWSIWKPLNFTSLLGCVSLHAAVQISVFVILNNGLHIFILPVLIVKWFEVVPKTVQEELWQVNFAKIQT